MKSFLLTLTLLAGGLLQAQTLTLFDCYHKAEANNPLQSERQHRRQILELNRKNLNSKWLPQIKAGAQALYMSDVVQFDQVLGSLPLPIDPNLLGSMPQEQYKATVEVSQTLYDGGAIAAAKKAEEAKWKADDQAVEVTFYQLRSQINDVYFAILKLDKQRQVLQLIKEQVDAQFKALQSAVENGVSLPQNLYALKAELLNVEQQQESIDIQQKSLRQTLQQLLGEKIDDNAVLELPKVTLPQERQIARPELQLFAAQQQALQANQKMISTQLRPKVMLFGTYGYGNPPGNNFFRDEFDDYYIIGAGLSWSPFDWHRSRRSKQAIEAQQQIVSARQQEFERKIRIGLENAKAEIEKTKQQLQKDPQLIELRKKITQAAASQLKSGVINATQYVQELHAEKQARLDMELHKIDSVRAKIRYLTLAGQL